MTRQLTPIPRRPDQTVEEMAEAMESAPPLTRMKGKSADDSAMLSAVHAGVTAIEQQKRVRLEDAETVKEHCKRYLLACERAGRCPTFAGLAASMGLSRKHTYDYIVKHHDESSKTLQLFQTIVADCLTQGGLSGSLNPIMSMWLAKNSGQGYIDRSELEIVQPSANHLEDIDIEAARSRYVDVLPYLTEEDTDGSQSS